MINVMLVEDQHLFRDGVEAIIDQTEDIEVIATADSGEAAMEQLNEIRPDVILMDIDMPNMDGLKTTVYVKENFPSIRVLLLTSQLVDELILRGINVGADGFLVKGVFKDTLIRSIRDVHRGEIVLSGEVAKLLVDKIRELTLDRSGILATRLENRGYHFTKRELEIAALFMENYTNSQIAQRLFLGEGTVKNYISVIYNKLNMRSRADAVLFLRSLLK